MATRKRAERRPQTDDRRPPTASDLTNLTAPAALPEDWRSTTLEDASIFEFQNGLWSGKKPPFREARVIRNTNFNNDGTLDLSDVARLQVSEKELASRQLISGDIIIERSGGGPSQPVGRVVYFDLPNTGFSFSNFTTRLRIVNRVHAEPKFVHYYLLHFHMAGGTEELQQRTTGIRNLAFSEYKGIAIPLPPLPEQRAIARVLSTIQRAIETQDKLIAAARHVKKALMRHLFTYGAVPPAVAARVPLKETEIGAMPEGWEMATVRDKYIFTSKPRGLRYDKFKTIPFVPMDLIPFGKTAFSDYIPKAPGEISSGTYFEAGDILLPKITPSFENGKQGIIPELPNGFGIATTEVIPIKEIAGVSDKRFLFYYLLVEGVRNLLAGKMEGSTGRQRLSRVVVETLQIPFPSLPEQRTIARILAVVDQKIATEEKRKAALQTLFKTTLHQLMTGQVRVKAEG
jgi:type I restriction enzyme S subunit